MKKIANILIIMMLMVSIASLAMADEEPGQNPIGEGQQGNGQNGENETSGGNDTGISDYNETGDPEGNETEDPEGNETEEPDGNETETPEGNETDDGLDNETEEEIGIMNSSLGAEIRLLQLEKAIVKNLMKGERAVDVLKGLDYNTSELESLLSKMNLLLEQVQAADPESNESVMIFVELKKQAKNLTKQFRETVKDLLDDGKLKELRAQIKDMIGADLENCSKKIRNKIKQFNRNQLHRLFGIIGESNYSLIEEYENGNLSMEQVKSQINKMVNQMNKEKKSEIFSEVKEENIKEKINGKAFAQNMKNNDKGKGKGKGH